MRQSQILIYSMSTSGLRTNFSKEPMTCHISLWETQLPLYIFPKTHSCPKFIRKCLSCYDINQRTIVTPTGEILFSINAQSIQQMMQAPTPEWAVPFSYEALKECYQKLDPASRAKSLKLSMAPDTPMPTKNPPHLLSAFSIRTKHIIFVLSYLLGYHTDPWVEEAMIGFSSTLSPDAKPEFLLNYA